MKNREKKDKLLEDQNKASLDKLYLSYLSWAHARSLNPDDLDVLFKWYDEEYNGTDNVS